MGTYLFGLQQLRAVMCLACLRLMLATDLAIWGVLFVILYGLGGFVFAAACTTIGTSGPLIATVSAIGELINIE